jgi:hypothetical protein
VTANCVAENRRCFLGNGAVGGVGGDITINADDISLRDGAFITTESFTDQRSGDILVTASGALSLSSAGVTDPVVLIRRTVNLPDGSTFELQVADVSEIGTATLRGPAGNIVVDVGSLVLENAAYISTSTLGFGDGGDIEIHARDTIRIDAAGSPLLTGIFAATSTSGAGGDITIRARELDVVRAGIISGETFGPAPAGNITVQADRVLLSGANAEGPTGISSQSQETSIGASGSIRIDAADAIEIRDRAFVTVASYGFGAAGDVNIAAGDSVILRNGAEISTLARQTSGGNLSIEAKTSLDLLDSRIAANAQQNGGNLDIDPDFVLLNRSSLVANAVQGNGGNMNIAAGTFLQSGDSTIDVSSQFGLAGTVSITAPEVDVAGALAVLPGNLAGADARLRDLCGARAGGGTVSSFVVASRGGSALGPGAFAPSFIVITTQTSPSNSNGDAHVTLAE